VHIHPIAKTLSKKTERKEKGKEELIRVINLMNSLSVSAQGRRMYLLESEIATVLKLKDNKTENFSGEMQPLQMNPPWECGLISLFHSYLAFSFCHFSKPTLWQLGVSE